MSETVITSKNLFAPAKRPNAVVDAGANESVDANVHAAGAPVDPTEVVVSTPVTPTVTPSVAPDPNWANCSDTSKPSWPGKKA